MAWKNWVETLFKKDKEAQAAKEARGVSVDAPVMVGGDGIEGGMEGHEQLRESLSIDNSLMLRYVDYENMDDYVETSVALDLYADDATVPDSIHKRRIWATSKDIVIRDILDDCLTRRIRIEEDIWVAMRTLCKYGNLFAEVLVNEIGVVGLNWLPTPSMRRVVDEKGSLLGFIQDVSGRFNFPYKNVITEMKKGNLPEVDDQAKNEVIFFHPWQVVHWRLRSKKMRAQYGFSILDSARWIWKRLQMMEDTAMVQKLTRAPGRYAFYVDTGDLPPREAMALVKKVKRGYKKTKLLDPATGKLDFKYNPLSPHEDFWIPTRGGTESTRIEVISGPDVQMMEDVEYFQRKLLASIKVPKSYIGLEEGADTKANLAQEDVRFARTCMRIQSEFIVGVNKVLRVHMAALNLDPDSVKWTIKMTIPSAIFEMQQIEVLNAQAALANDLQEFMDKEWVLKHVFHFTDDDAAFLTQAKRDEMAQMAKDEAATQSDIVRLFPDAAGTVDAGDAMESVSDKELRGLKKIVEDGSDVSFDVIKRLKRLESSIASLTKLAKRDSVLRRQRSRK